ncbi:MAG: hypothetical protein WC590_13440 [Burkholderiaceae bacterium]
MKRLRLAAVWLGLCAAASSVGAAAPTPPLPPIAKTDYDPFGTRLPRGLDAATLISLLMPMGDPSRVSLAGARSWPRMPDAYVAIVCERAAHIEPSVAPTCEQERSRDGVMGAPRVYVGIIEKKAGEPPRLIAASGAIDRPVNWARTTLIGSPDTPTDPGTDNDVPQSWMGFDLAPYAIQDGRYAFGLRGTWNEWYSGGGATWEALYLFSVEGDRLATILAEPMFSYVNIGGDWNKDGTRNHDIDEHKLILQMSSRKTSGYYDVLLKGGEATRTLKWSAREAAYVDDVRP